MSPFYGLSEEQGDIIRPFFEENYPDPLCNDRLDALVTEEDRTGIVDDFYSPDQMHAFFRRPTASETRRQDAQRRALGLPDDR